MKQKKREDSNNVMTTNTSNNGVMRENTNTGHRDEKRREDGTAVKHRLTIVENNIAFSQADKAKLENIFSSAAKDKETSFKQNKKVEPSSPMLQSVAQKNMSANNVVAGLNDSKKRKDYDDRDLSNNSSNNLAGNANHKQKLIKSISYKSQAGKSDNGLTKTNQDNYFILSKIFGIEEYHICGVLDGHGNNGHHASNAITMFLSEYFQKYENYVTIKKSKSSSPVKTPSNIKEEFIYERLKDNNYEVIRNAFARAEYELSLAKFDVNFSGSTTVLVLIIMDKIICANAGDSRAILVNERTREKKSNLIYNYL